MLNFDANFAEAPLCKLCMNVGVVMTIRITHTCESKWMYSVQVFILFSTVNRDPRSNVHLLSAGQEREQTQGRTSEVVDTKSRVVEVTQPDPCGGTPTNAAGAALNPTKGGSSTGTTGKY